MTTEKIDKVRAARRRVVAVLAQAGVSQADIARALGVSRERIRQIVAAQEEGR